MSALQSLDYFAIKNHLQFRGKETYQTKLGGVIFLFIAVLLILFCFGIGNDIIYREKPETIFSVNFLDRPEQSTDNMFFMIAPVYKSGLGITQKERKYNLYLEYADADWPSHPAIFTNVTLQSCLTTEYYKKNPNLTKAMINDYPNYMCIPDGWKNKSLLGKYGQSTFKLYQFRME